MRYSNVFFNKFFCDRLMILLRTFFFFQAEDGIRDDLVTGVQTCALPIFNYLALFARVNEYGFLETPYRKVTVEKNGKGTKVTASDEIEYVSADDEQRYYITHAGMVTEEGVIEDDRVPARYRGEFLEIEKENISYVDITPLQVVGSAASLIPFVANDDAQRSLMGTHMQCQAVPLAHPHSPIVGTGVEEVVAGVIGRQGRGPFDGAIYDAGAERSVLD